MIINWLYIIILFNNIITSYCHINSTISTMIISINNNNNSNIIQTTNNQISLKEDNSIHRKLARQILKSRERNIYERFGISNSAVETFRDPLSDPALTSTTAVARYDNTKLEDVRIYNINLYLQVTIFIFIVTIF
jgi:hypothetical protein